MANDNLSAGTNMLGPYSYQARKIRNFLLLINHVREDKDYVYLIDNDEATLLMYYGDGVSIKTPQFIGGENNSQYPVKHIAPTCFNYNTTVRSVEISDGVVSIG